MQNKSFVIMVMGICSYSMFITFFSLGGGGGAGKGGRDMFLAWAMWSILFYIPLPTESQRYRLTDSTFISITF